MDMHTDAWRDQNNLSTCCIFVPSVSHTKEEGRDDGQSAEMLRWLMTYWQECRLISEEYFPPVFSVIDHYNNSIVLLLQLVQ